MASSTTWFYRAGRSVRQTARRLTSLTEAYIRGAETPEEEEDEDDPTAPPDEPTDDEPYTGLPARGRLGFERPSYVSYLEGTGDGPAAGTAFGDLHIATVLARTAEWEVPSRYELVNPPSRAQGAYNVLGDGVIVWNGTTFPAQLGTDDVSDTFRVRAYLRDQVAECSVTINFVILEELREINTLTFGAKDAVDEGLPPGSQHSAWSFAVPTPAPLPDLNLRAAWATLQGISTIVVNVGQLIANLWRLKDETVTWDNPYASRDWPTNVQVGGVVVRPGFIPLKDLFTDRRAGDRATAYRISTLGDKFDVVLKPFGAAIVDGLGGSGVDSLRDHYGVCVVWMPKEISNETISDTLTIAAEDLDGNKQEITFPIHCTNKSGSGPGRLYAGLDSPEENVLRLGDASFGAYQGVYGSDIFLSPGDRLNGDYTIDMTTQVVDNSTLEILSARLHNNFGLFDSTRGSAFQYIITGKIICWQVSWATADQSGSLNIIPSSWVENIVPYGLFGSAFRLITNFGFTPTGTLHSSTVPENTSQTDIVYNTTLRTASLGPHLRLQGTSEGFLRFRPSDMPGSTIVQIRPYLIEWNAFTIPLPVGPAGRWVLKRLLRRVGLNRFTPAERARIIADSKSIYRGNKYITNHQRLALQLQGQAMLTSSKGLNRIARLYNVIARPGLIGSALGQAERRSFARGMFRAGTQGGSYVRRVLGVRSGVEASQRSAQAAIRQAFLQQRALQRESNITGTGVNRIDFEGLYSSPSLNRVYWAGDYICCRFNTLEGGAGTSDFDRLPTSIPPEVFDRL